MKTVKPQPRIDAEPEVTGAQLAQHLNLNVATINNWRLKGMPAKQYNTRLFRYKLSEVEKWLQDRAKNITA
jgi:phage terminase Nu1 subunit (DNA packaging protein)